MRCQCVCVEWSELQFDTPVAVSSATGPGTFALVTWSNLHHSFNSNCFCLFLNERETWQRRIRQKMEETGQMRCVFIVNVSYWKQTNNNKKAAEKKRRKEEKKKRSWWEMREGDEAKEKLRVCVSISTDRRATWDVTAHSPLIKCLHFDEIKDENTEPKSLVIFPSIDFTFHSIQHLCQRWVD